MLAKSPLIYWSLPVGLALVIGIIWSRRKKHLPPPDSDRVHSSSSHKTFSTDLKSDPTINIIQHSASLLISTTGSSTVNSSPPEYLALGKSAPIDINPNRITPEKLTICKIERAILDPGVLPEEEAAASFDDEEDFELIDSPHKLVGSGGGNGRFLLNARTVKEGNPIVTKANKTPKISPEHSFVEAKYAEQQSVDNNRQSMQEIANTIPSEPSLLIQSSSSNNSENIKDQALERSSPSTSLSSLNSKDSGKGSTPPRFDEPISSYEFLVKQDLVGTILGRKGAFVREIKKKCQANVVIKKHPTNEFLKVVRVEGKQEQIAVALKMMRARLPIKRHPGLTMNQVFLETPRGISYLNPSELQLNVSYLLFFCRFLQVQKQHK